MFGLISAKIHHARIRPRRNSFRYGATYVAIPLSQMTSQRRGLFSIDCRNLFSLRSRDYGDGISPVHWIARVLEEWSVPQADGEIVLVTMPRVFGFAFNPVSFWLCRDRSGALRAVVAEVNNTFGERHCYVCFHDDRRPIIPRDILTARKVFHVSPFMETKGQYSFRFVAGFQRLAIFIDLDDESGLILSTSLAGQIRPLTSWGLLCALLANPIMPLKVIALIHYQAVKLFLKRVPHIHKPEAPATPVSH